MTSASRSPRRTGEAGARRVARTLAVVIAALAGGSACGGNAAPPPARTVSLRMRGTPPDATVTIDDRIVGSLGLVSAHGVALPAGQHRITVEARGYLPFDTVVVAPAEGPSTPIPVDVALVPVPD